MLLFSYADCFHVLADVEKKIRQRAKRNYYAWDSLLFFLSPDTMIQTKEKGSLLLSEKKKETSPFSLFPTVVLNLPPCARSRHNQFREVWRTHDASSLLPCQDHWVKVRDISMALSIHRWRAPEMIKFREGKIKSERKSLSFILPRGSLREMRKGVLVNNKRSRNQRLYWCHEFSLSYKHCFNYERVNTNT